MLARSDIVAAARAYKDTPFRHQGRSREHGVDCVGLVICVARDLGLDGGFDVTGYDRKPDGATIQRVAAERMAPKPPDAAAPGDVLLFAENRMMTHMGIVAELHGHPSLIHAWVKVGKVVEHGLSGYWLRQRRGCFAYRGVA